MRKRFPWLLALSGLGFLDSIWLLILHVTRGSFAAMCGSSPVSSCEPTYDEKYSVWFGVPVPVFSLLYFALWIALLLRRRRMEGEEERARPTMYLWLLGFWGLGSAAYMMFISFAVLRTFCPYCAVLWGVLILLCGISWSETPRFPRSWERILAEDLRTGYRSRWLWGISLLSASVLAVAHTLTRPSGGVSGSPVAIADEESRSLGSEKAPVTIAVYTDFQCPWCRVASEVLVALAREIPDRVRVVFKFFPLDSACNESVGRPMHPYACAAAEASYCAAFQGKFWPYHDLLFTSQNDLSEERLKGFARLLGLDLPKFDACRREARAREAVVKNVREGISLGIEGTPSLFVNGQRYKGPLTLSALRETVAAFR